MSRLSGANLRASGLKPVVRRTNGRFDRPRLPNQEQLLPTPFMSGQTLYPVCRLAPDNSVWFHRPLQARHTNRHVRLF